MKAGNIACFFAYNKIYINTLEMKNLLLITILSLISFVSFGQLPYSWTVGTNPGWVSSNPGLRRLSWQPALGTVSSNENGYYYNNNQNTTYTSPVRNTTCSSASLVHVMFQLYVDLEVNYDYIYFEYSANGGTSWATFGTWTGFLGTVNVVYDIPTSANAIFRFRFQSDNFVNSWGFGYPYYVDINTFSLTCITYLPIELISFEGRNENYNILTWSTASENNNDYFTVERSEDGISWNIIDTVDGAGNSQLNINYSLVDNSYREVINYYRLKQVDYDGKSELFEKIVAIDNRAVIKKVVKITNLLGQDVDEYYKGVVIILYSDGTTNKELK